MYCRARYRCGVQGISPATGNLSWSETQNGHSALSASGARYSELDDIQQWLTLLRNGRKTTTSVSTICYQSCIDSTAQVQVASQDPGSSHVSIPGQCLPLVPITRPGPDDHPIHGLIVHPSLGPSLSPGRGPMPRAEAVPVSPSSPSPGWGVRWALAATSCPDVGSPWCSQTPGSPWSRWGPGVIMYSPFARLFKV